MKQIKILVLGIILFMTNTIQAQDPHKFVQIEFLDFTPEWFHYIEDSTAIGVYSSEKFDYISQFVFMDKIIQDSFIYSLYHTRLQCHYDGTYIEKRNILTGEKVWSKLYDLRISEDNELPARMIMNESGELEVFGYKIIEGCRFEWYAFKESKFMIRKFDKDSGDLLLESIGQLEDTLAPILYCEKSTAFEMFKKGEGQYQYIKKFDWDTTGYVFMTTMNELGQQVDYKKVEIEREYENVSLGKFNLINDSTYITTCLEFNDSSRIGDDHKYKYYIEKYDDKLNKISGKEVGNILKLKNRYYVYTKYFDKDYIILYVRNEPELFDWWHYYYIFDHKGNLLDSIVLYPREDDMYGGTLTRITEDEFLISGININAVDKDFTLSFYKKKIGEPLRIIKRIKLGPDIYFAAVNKMDILSNGDVLCEGTSGPLITSGHNIWPFKMLISAKDLEGGVAVEEIAEVTKLNLNLYPNPAKDKLQIEFAEIFTGKLEVIDELGREVLSKDIAGSKVVSIDVSGLDSGSYFVKANNEKDKYKVKAFVKK